MPLPELVEAAPLHMQNSLRMLQAAEQVAEWEGGGWPVQLCA